MKISPPPPRFLFLILFFLIAANVQAQIHISFTPADYHGYNVSCFDSKDGRITVNVTGGTPPYTYLWSNDQTTATITGLSADYYDVMVTDSDSLQEKSGINLSSPEVLKLDLSIYEYNNGFNISLYGASNGSITTSVTGGVSPFTYEWEDGPTTQNRSMLSGGFYVLKVTDTNNCLASEQTSLSEPERDDWTMGGNANTNPANHFIGTTDNKDLVFKTNAVERLRIGNNGKITTSANTYFEKLYVNRISSFDTVIYIGDSTLIFNGNNQTIYGGNSGLYRGLGLGNSQNKCGGTAAVGIGVVSQANGDRSVSIGYMVKTTATQAITIGSGISYNNSLDNSSANSLWVGFNSNIPTLVVTPANGVGTTGDVHIGVGDATHPVNEFPQKLEVNYNNSHGGIVLNRVTDAISPHPNSAHSEIYFNKNGYEKWAIGNDAGEGGNQNFFIWDHVAGAKRFFIDEEGRVGIGGAEPPTGNGSAYRLYVLGGIATRDVKVQATGWPDYVLKKDFALMTIDDLDNFISENEHLPGFPSAKEIEENDGYEAGNMIERQQKQIEQQALYIISIKSELEEQKRELAELKKAVKQLK